MPRLPQPGGDDGIWGDVLNDFLKVEHNADGTLKNARDATKLQGRAIDTTAPADDQILTYDAASSQWTAKAAPSSTSPSNTVVTEMMPDQASTAGSATAYSRGDHTHGTPPETPDATAVTKGKLQLAGDLSGTADAPTVPGLSGKADDAAVVHLAGAETVTGAKTFEVLYSTGNGYFDIEAYGASPSASAATNTAAILAAFDAAKVKGGTVRSGPGVFDFEGIIHFTPNGNIGVDLIGAGAWATTFRATTAASQIKLSTGGGAVAGLYGGAFTGNFKVDGNNIATAPLFIGLTTDRTFANIHVWKAVGPGLTLDQTQNSTFIELMVSYCGTGVLLDNGASNNAFIKIQLNDNDINLQTAQTLPTSQVGTLHGNKWFGGIIEKTDINHIDWGAGTTGWFFGTTITALQGSVSQPLVRVRDATPDANGAGTPRFVSCEFQGLVVGGSPIGYALESDIGVTTQFTDCTFTNLETAFVINNGANVNLDVLNATNVTNKKTGTGHIRPYEDVNILRWPQQLGTRLAFWGEGSAGTFEYLMGVENNRLAMSIPLAVHRFTWTRGGTNGPEIARLEGDGRLGIRTADFGGGTGAAIGIANTATAPNANPVDGGVLYAEGGVLKYRASSGAVFDATQQPANPDTTGATLAALETEVNELKALLRNAGLLAS
jgi:hypothetical protein